MTRRALRRVAFDRLDTRVADVAEQFDRLQSDQKLQLMTDTPAFYLAVARMVRMRQVALEVDR